MPIQIGRSGSSKQPIDITQAPYNALLDGSNERATLATAVAAAVAAKRPLLIPGSMRADVGDGSGAIAVTGDLTIVGQGQTLSVITSGPDPTTAGAALFQPAAGVNLDLHDISLVGPATNMNGTGHVTYGVNHLGGFATVRLVRASITGFTYGIVGNWASDSVEGRTDKSCGTTASSTTVTDTLITSGDVGANVQGPGIPAGTTIASVNAGVSFTMSAAATATATTPLVIGGSTFAHMGGVSVDAWDSTIEGNGANAIILQGTGRLYLRRCSIPRWGLNASNQYHGIYVHSGVTVDIDGCEWGTGSGTGYCLQTYHQTGMPDYVRIRGIKVIAGQRGFLLNPWVRSMVNNFEINCAYPAFDCWGDADILDGRISGQTQAGGHLRPYSDSTFPRTPQVFVRRVKHTGLVAGSIYGVDTTGLSGADFTVTDCAYDVTPANAWNLHATGTFRYVDCRFSDSITFGVSTLANRPPSSSKIAAGSRHFDSDLGVPIFTDGLGGMVQTMRDIGFPGTLPPYASVGVRASTLANRVFYIRNLLGAGKITKFGIHVGTSSGNLNVGVFANTGTGRLAKPGAIKGSTGLVACPATGYQEVAATAAVNVALGDWFAVILDNTTATLNAVAAQTSSNLYLGLALVQDGLTDLPSTATPSASAISLPFAIQGVP